MKYKTPHSRCQTPLSRRPLAVLALWSAEAHALSLSLVGALTSDTTSDTNGSGGTFQGKIGYGAGLLVDTRLMPGIGLEAGAI
jgi:hypothetical protein